MTSRPQVVVVDANAYWTEQLFSALATDFDILLVKPREIRAYHRQSPHRGVTPLLVHHSTHVKSLWLPMPPQFTTLTWPLARRILTAALVQHGAYQPDVLVLCFPEYIDLWTDLNPRLSMYYAYDDYSAHWPKRGNRIKALEREAVGRAHLTIAISKHRVEQLRQLHPRRSQTIVHLPIGASPQFFADAVEHKPPPSLQTIRRPLAGYIGALNHRFDFPFFYRVAVSRPGISFVLGGRLPMKRDGDSTWWDYAQRTQQLPNVHFLGWVNHADLAHHLMCFDVLLMLYSHCAFNQSACPAKLWDYLGIGTPIVATSANPETLLWSDFVSIADSPEDFSLRLDVALQEGSKRSNERMAVARAHTWGHLGVQLRSLIAEAGLTQPLQTRPT